MTGSSTLPDLSALRNALLSLPPTGVDGFEGLLAIALQEITCVPFRLAASGRQFGLDGKAIDDSVCFEAKRYESGISRDVVISKIPDLVRGNDYADIVWVLGATCPVPTQLADALKTDGDKQGIFSQIVDWLPEDCPALAVLLTMGGQKVVDFIEAQVTDKALAEKAAACLLQLPSLPVFGAHAGRLRAELDAASVATAKAKRANSKWIEKVFDNRQMAIQHFGQPLAPGSAHHLLPRAGIVSQIHQAIAPSKQCSIAFILGDEGCGKSWVAAISWQQLVDKPLTLFLSAEDFAKISHTPSELEDVIVHKLIEQTGDGWSAALDSRWRRRLAAWKSTQVTEPSRLLVIVDGINQRPQVNWGRILESLAIYLHERGGSLVATVRMSFFEERVRLRLHASPRTVTVPVWSDAERDEILRQHAVVPGNLKGRTATSLRNPRLLTIALTLLSSKEISDVRELSIGYLLFKHMHETQRVETQPETIDEFVTKLKTHAREVLDRIQRQDHGEKNVFEADFAKVSEGHFFERLPGEDGRYLIKDDGLAVALGFSVLDQLRQAIRLGQDLDDVLATTLEPVAALDNTADVVMAALTILTVGGSYNQEIARSLVVGFVGLQNPDQGKFDAFRSLGEKQPLGLLAALRDMSLSDAHHPNLDWLQTAAQSVDFNNPLVRIEVGTWLSCKSLAPELGMLSHSTRDPAAKVAEERAERERALQEKIDRFSRRERELFDSLPDVEGNTTDLARVALALLAGKPLAVFTKHLVDWCFSNAFNSELFDAVKDFYSLVRFNAVDWAETRKGLLDAAAPLRAAETSETGKWALVYVLRSLATPVDVAEVETLIQELTRDRPKFDGFRLVEKYCANDPCNPASLEPANITDTAVNYRQIPVSAISNSVGMSSEHHFFEMARPGIARFERAVGVAKHRELFDDVITRSDLGLKLGLYQIEEHAALIQRHQSEQLVKKWRDLRDEGIDRSAEKDGWIISQYLLLLALSQQDAEERLALLLEVPAETVMMMRVIDRMRPISPDRLDQIVQEVSSRNLPQQERLLLEFVNYSGMPVTERIKTFAIERMASPNEGVRRAAITLIAEHGDAAMLRTFAEGSWTASAVEKDHGYEAWYGSIALLRATELGIIESDSLLERASTQVYGKIALRLGGSAAHEISRRVNASIDVIAELADDFAIPDIVMELDSTRDGEPPLVSVKERPPRNNSEIVERLNASSEQSEANWKRNYEAYEAFRDELTKADAALILEQLRSEEFEAILSASPSFTERWLQNFLAMEDGRLSHLCNLALLLARALSFSHPANAARLFKRLRNVRPLVRFAYGRAGIDLNLISIWSAQDCDEIDHERFNRLDSRTTDHEIATEVLGAIAHGKAACLERYVSSKIESERPVDVARGIMVAGFSNDSAFNTCILEKFEHTEGLLGAAYDAACYAYERNQWARYWYGRMCETNSSEDFWAYQIQLTKIADGRHEFWRKEFEAKGRPSMEYLDAASRELKQRYTRWERYRSGKLFGADCPRPIFVQLIDQ